jgi:hypothetical protein
LLSSHSRKGSASSGQHQLPKPGGEASDDETTANVTTTGCELINSVEACEAQTRLCHREDNEY